MSKFIHIQNLIFQSAQKIFGGEVKNHILLFIKKSDKDFDTKLADFKEAAKDFKGEVSITFSSCHWIELGSFCQV